MSDSGKKLSVAPAYLTFFATLLQNELNSERIVIEMYAFSNENILAWMGPDTGERNKPVTYVWKVRITSNTLVQINSLLRPLKKVF